MAYMGHRIGEWALQQAFLAGVSQWRVLKEVVRQILKHLMKASNLRWEIRKRLGSIPAAHEVSTRIPEDAGHVPHEFSGSSDLVTCLKRPEGGRCVPQRLLCPIGEGGQEVAAQRAFVVKQKETPARLGRRSRP